MTLATFLFAVSSAIAKWQVAIYPVGDLEAGFKRIDEYSVPLEEQHMQQLYHTGTAPNKILIVNGEARPERITTIRSASAKASS